MTDREALLRAVLADPDDDTVRLVYADALEEAGDEPCPACSGIGYFTRPCPRCGNAKVLNNAERAEFVRVQCELAKMPIGCPWPVYNTLGRQSRCGNCPDCRRHDALRRREGELLFPGGKPRDHREWFPEFDGDWLFKKTGDSMTYGNRKVAYVSRGFVERVSCTSGDWLSHAHALSWRPCAECVDKAEWRRRHPGFEPGTLAGGCKCRPFPPGAQPVERVRLTTWPDYEEHTIGRLFPEPGWHPPRKLRETWRSWEELGRPATGRESVARLLAAEWPGVEFELPRAVRGTAAGFHINTGTYASPTWEEVRGVADRQSFLPPEE